MKEAMAGKTARFDIECRDGNGLLQPYGQPLEVSFQGPRPIYAPDVKEASRGVYHVEYQPIVAGSYQMTVLAGGKAVEGSPFEVKVTGLQRADTKPAERASEVSEELLNSTSSLKGKATSQVTYSVHGPGAAEAVAGKTSKFELHARDQDGLLVPNRGKEKIAVSFAGPRPVYAPSVVEDTSARGLYKVEYQVMSAGVYQMTITVDGTAIPGSPFPVSVSSAGSTRAPPPASSAAAVPAPSVPVPTLAAPDDKSMERFKWDVSGANLSKAIAGKAFKWQLLAKDRRSRPLSEADIKAIATAEDGQEIALTLADTVCLKPIGRSDYVRRGRALGMGLSYPRLLRHTS
jgi:hypothetical protein